MRRRTLVVLVAGLLLYLGPMLWLVRYGPSLISPSDFFPTPPCAPPQYPCKPAPTIPPSTAPDAG